MIKPDHKENLGWQNFLPAFSVGNRAEERKKCLYLGRTHDTMQVV